MPHSRSVRMRRAVAQGLIFGAKPRKGQGARRAPWSPAMAGGIGRMTAMSVRSGREIMEGPGPTILPDEVLNAMHRQAIDIYSGPLLAITDSLFADLRRLFVTDGRCYIYIANGHGAWEAALTNVLSRGDKVLVLESGRVALSWGGAAGRTG